MGQTGTLWLLAPRCHPRAATSAGPPVPGGRSTESLVHDHFIGRTVASRGHESVALIQYESGRVGGEHSQPQCGGAPSTRPRFDGSDERSTNALSTSKRADPHRPQFDDGVLGRDTAGHTHRSAPDECGNVVGGRVVESDTPAPLRTTPPVRHSGCERVRGIGQRSQSQPPPQWPIRTREHPQNQHRHPVCRSRCLRLGLDHRQGAVFRDPNARNRAANLCDLLPSV